jgi:hypothetical protein
VHVQKNTWAVVYGLLFSTGEAWLVTAYIPFSLQALLSTSITLYSYYIVSNYLSQIVLFSLIAYDAWL